MHFDTLWIFVLGKPDFRSIYYNFQTNCWIILATFFFQEKQTAFANILSPHTQFLMTQSSCCDVIILRHIRPAAPVEFRDRGGSDEPKKCWYLQKEKS